MSCFRTIHSVEAFKYGEKGENKEKEERERERERERELGSHAPS